MLLKIDGFVSLSTIVVYNDDVMSRDSIPASWLAAAVYKRYPTVPWGTVISISLPRMHPMSAQALWVHISVFIL